jgi:hypothetical protein
MVLDPPYQVTGSPATCQCKDYDHAPEHLCSHRLAVGFQRKVQELLAAEPGAQSPPVETQPLPEALFSATLKGTVGGHETLLTVRGMTATEFTSNLQAVRDLLDAPAQPSQGQPLSREQHNAAAMHRRVTDFCAVHNVPMKLNQKEGRSWWSHYVAEEGRFCKGR